MSHFHAIFITFELISRTAEKNNLLSVPDRNRTGQNRTMYNHHGYPNQRKSNIGIHSSYISLFDATTFDWLLTYLPNLLAYIRQRGWGLGFDFDFLFSVGSMDVVISFVYVYVYVWMTGWITGRMGFVSPRVISFSFPYGGRCSVKFLRIWLGRTGLDDFLVLV